MEDIQLYSINIKSSIRNYEVNFSHSLDDSLKQTIKPGDVVMIDSNVFKQLNDDVLSTIVAGNHLLVDANEGQKSYLAIAPLIEKIIDNKFRRGNRLIAIGGGITQDITAFMASILYRGVEWVFFPSTLLAQADSCIGGKTSINIGNFKNQLGNFYPPSQIYIIPELVKSLPLRDIKSGLGEMLHFYLVSGEKDFQFFKENYESAFSDDEALLTLIKKNLEIKKGFIERDEFDRGERLLLNYGHSFGHAIESLTNYSIPHGIAVSYGMDLANFISVKKGFLSEETRYEIRSQVEKIWDGISLGDIDIGKFETALSRDKKNIGNTYRLILSKGVGSMFVHGVEPSREFTVWLNEYFSDLG